MFCASVNEKEVKTVNMFLICTLISVETEDDDEGTVREKLINRYTSDVVGPPGNYILFQENACLLGHFPVIK